MEGENQEEEEEEGEEEEEEDDDLISHEDGDGEGHDERDVDDILRQGNYKDVLHSLSKQWLFTQLSHKVSGRATNHFWNICMTFLPTLLKLHEQEGNTKPIPKFLTQKNKLYKQYCPPVEMEFAYRNKSDNSIRVVNTSTAPIKELQRNNEFEKLYEMAYIKVKTEMLSRTK